jgi:hypothetical protein
MAQAFATNRFGAPAIARYSSSTPGEASDIVTEVRARVENARGEPGRAAVRLGRTRNERTCIWPSTS